MQFKKFLSLAFTLTCLMFCMPQQAFGDGNSDEVLVPANTIFALELLSPISTKTNQKGDKFDCKVLSPVQYAGDIVSGHISKVKNAGKANGKSSIELSFDTIALSDGRVGSFNAQVQEVNDVKNASAQGVADNEGTVKGKSRVKIGVKRAVLGALIGGGIGALLGGGQGAAAGAIIGASVGITSTLATEGPNLEFNTGTQFTVTKNGPSRQVQTSK